ncbi:hypothetical protein B0H10DRAFT_1951016 [Mycena sp. CBHHK59/15]|nr:hypothetical protein B0H10DRAFT_1952763 [Mycena sp. CBHHK59/15]KAJ6613991.1 hypothetical protein B0H10DRAFT_1951016 [Mycena sp. CBHHK59/15]
MLFELNEEGNFQATQPLGSISCAVIHSTLHDWSSGEHNPTNFDSTRSQDNYEIHIMLFQDLQQTKPLVYRETMEHIFREASNLGDFLSMGGSGQARTFMKEACRHKFSSVLLRRTEVLSSTSTTY